MPRCNASKLDGTPCERIVGASHSYCYSHDPKRSEERHKAASKAARSKPNREISEIKERLRGLAEDVLAGRVEKGDGAVVSQIYNVLLRAIEQERKLRETEELEERLSEIEAKLGAYGGGSRAWR